MIDPISITAIASISSLGISLEDAWRSYQRNAPLFVKKEFNGAMEWIAPLAEHAAQEILTLKQSDTKYKNLDDSVLFAIFAARKAMKKAKWRAEHNFGINIGSSRGATALFEKYHRQYLKEQRVPTLSSPTTTLGNISSWVAHDLQSQGPVISHSITCSTALHALLNGVAWLKSGMTNEFMVGGSEAPLTSFTIAQMKALKIYAKTTAIANAEYPCRALDLSKTKNSMILGEGASVACLERGLVKDALAIIEGVGFATEILKHNVSISSDATCFQRSMQMALGETDPNSVDVIVTHTPGTVKGDRSEFMAIEKVFCDKMPFLTTNKWKIGHTFGTSGMLSVEMAILMLQYQQVLKTPLANNSIVPQQIKRIVVNAVGFGGNAVSILLSK